jgi:hypothetical protein
MSVNEIVTHVSKYNTQLTRSAGKAKSYHRRPLFISVNSRCVNWFSNFFICLTSTSIFFYWGFVQFPLFPLICYNY